jgi:hypothetical protein
VGEERAATHSRTFCAVFFGTAFFATTFFATFLTTFLAPFLAGVAGLPPKSICTSLEATAER